MKKLKRFKAFLLALIVIIASGPLRIKVKADTNVPTHPTITVTCNGTTVQNNSAANNNVTVSIGGSSDPSGIKEYDYYINKNGVDGIWQKYNSAFTISDEGYYTVYTRAVNNNGISDTYPYNCDWTNTSFQVIKSSTNLQVKNYEDHLKLNWNTSDNKPYNYTLYKSGGNDYVEGSNVIPEEDSTFTDGQISSDWNKGFTNGATFSVKQDNIGYYLQTLYSNNKGALTQNCAVLLACNLQPNQEYKLVINYRYPDINNNYNHVRDFGIVNIADNMDLYDLYVKNENTDWSTYSANINSGNNTSLRIREYVDPQKPEIDIRSVQLIPVYPKSIAQITSTSYEDTSATDMAAPNPVSNISVSPNGDNTDNIAITSPRDNGTKYKYYVEAVGADQLKRDSALESATVTSGVKGYYYKIDIDSNNSDFNVNDINVNYFQGNNISCNLSPGTYYFHSKVIDNAGNLSDASTIMIKITPNTALTIPISSISSHFGPIGSNILQVPINVTSNGAFSISVSANNGEHLKVKVDEQNDSAYKILSETSETLLQNEPAAVNKKYILDIKYDGSWSVKPGTYPMPIDVMVKQ